MTLRKKMLGPTIILTLAAGVLAGISGLFGFNGPSLVSAQADTTAPTISSIAVTSDPDDDDSIYAFMYDDGVYGIGDEIEVTVTFSENVTVTGSPRLELTIGSSAKNAAYKSAAGSKVVFGYTVASGDSDTDGISIAADKLTLNGGTIKDAADNAANLSQGALSAQSGHKVDGIRPTITTDPHFSGSTFSNDGVHTVGEYISAWVGFSEEVIGIGAQPTVVMPLLGIDVGGTTRYAKFVPLPINDWRDEELHFLYQVVKGDLDLDGISVAANSVGLNGGTIRDAAGNDAVLTHSAVPANDNFIVDGVPATVKSVAITSNPGSDNTYDVRETIEVTVTFSEAVFIPQYYCGQGGLTVLCMPRLELNIGGEAKTAMYNSHSGAAVAFSYRVQQGDNDAGGISIDANKLNGYIKDDIGDHGGEDADLTHDAVADDAGHKVATLVQPPKSRDATLSALSLRSESYVWVYAPPDTTENTDVANYVSSVTVTALVNHSGASYVVKLGGVTDADGTVSLAVGSNVITVVVTAEDGSTTKTYTVTVTRAVPSTDATLNYVLLSSIDIGAGLGKRAYAQTQSSFTASVYNSVTQTTVTPTVNHSAASYVVKLGGVTDADGVMSLAVGSNVITIEVTAEDGQTTRTYTVTVNRATASAPTTGELSTDDPPVNFRTVSYTHEHVYLAYDNPRNRGITGHVAQRYKHDGDDFVSAGADGRHEILHNSDIGGYNSSWTFTEPEPDTLYKWVVQLVNSQNATVIETSLSVRTPPEPGSTPLSSDATLSDLTLSGIDFDATDFPFFNPSGFDETVTSYVGSVANSVSQTTVTATTRHSSATYAVKLGGVTDADGTVSLAVGRNVITVEVTAEDGETTRTYTVTVTRVSSDASTDATLRRLVLSDVDFGTFVPSTTTYTAQVANSVAETLVSPYVSHRGASYVVKLGGVTDINRRISLAVGSNVITVEVTAEDLVTTKTYTITVTRAAVSATAPDLVVSSVSIDSSTFGDPSFTLHATAHNQGSGSSGSTTLRYYLSADSTITSRDFEIGTDAVNGLAASGSSEESIDLTAPSAPGTRYYGACVDAVSDESDETNNCSGSVAFTVPAETSTDATLKSLTLSDINFGTFSSDTTSYTASVANSVSRTTVTPTVNDTGASYVIKLGGVTNADGAVSLAVGSNVIAVVVMAEDGSTTKTYTVTVTRAAPPSSDATLKGLSLSGVGIGTFKSVTTSYSAQVANGVTQTTVTPTVNHSGASYVIKLGGVTDSDGVIPLSVGRNVITIEVTAEDTTTKQTYTVTVTRAQPPSSDAALRALTLSDINFGTFASGTTSYSANVGNDVSQTAVTPTVNHSGASYVIKLGGVTDADGTVSLSVGRNVITIELTAEDGSTTRTYTVTITRAEPPSTDATLRGLTLSGTDIGTFDSTTTSYSADVDNDVVRTIVTPTVNDSGASYVIKLGGVTDADGTVSLAVGRNVITIEVTAEDGSTTRTYTVTVTRAEPPSTDATLSALALKTETHLWAFAPVQNSLSVDVENDVSTLTVDALANDSGASYVIKLGGVTDADGTVSLAVGSNVITIEVTAEDGETTKTYTVTVTRAEAPTPAESSDATLRSLTLSGVDFGTFDSTTTSYAAGVANSVSQTAVTPTVNHSGASYVIKLGGVADADGTVPLAVGSNVITVEVTAEDGETTRTYTVTVTRSAPPSTDAKLSSLTLSGINFGTFASGTTSYTASVSNGVTQTTVTPTVSHSGAGYIIRRNGVTDADGIVSLSVGSNVITVEVTAQDRQTKRTYTVTVTRAAPLSTDATLSALILSGIDFGTFDSSTVSYTAQVANSVSQTTVSPTVNNSGASYVIRLGGVTDSDGVISLAVGGNVITVEVTAQDRQTIHTYTVTVTRASQDETPPRSVDPVTGELPTDDPRMNFRVSGYAHDWIDIAWAVPQNRGITEYVLQRYEHDGSGFVSSGSGEGARFKGNTNGGEEHSLRNAPVEPDTLYQYVLSLNDDSGTTIIESSSTVRTLSSDATLSALTFSGIDFGTFDPETADYTADVANDVSQTTVTAATNHTGASYAIKLGGVEVADGDIALEMGENVITVEVTAEDGETTLTYTVTITRDEVSLLTGELASDDPPLNFRITSYGEDEVSLSWEIPNNRGITSYVLDRYDHDGTEFSLSDRSISGGAAGGSSVSESGTDLASDTRYRYDLALKSDDGTVIFEKSLEVRTLEAGAAVPVAGAALSALSLSGVELSPEFISSTYRYTASVASDITHTTVTATLNDASASYAVNLGGTVDDDAMLDLTPGRNVVTVHVTAADDVTARVYTVIVNREKAADELSDDASLRALFLSEVDFGMFDRDNTAYSAEVANEVLQTTVTPVRRDVEATHVVKLGSVESTDGIVEFGVGENIITIEVTAEDGETTRTYTVTVTRAEAPAPEPADTCVQSIHADGTTEGSWDDTCLSEKDAPGGAGDRYARFYTFTLTESTDVVISLNSEEDTYLYLLYGHGKDGDTLHSNDDIASGGVNLNSRLSVTLQPGDYTIEATTYYAEREGDFTLTIEGLGEAEEPAPQPDPEPEPEVDGCVESVTADGTIEGSWDSTCLSDRAALSGTGDRHSRFYTFTLDEAADVTLTLESDEDTYLYLLEGHGRSETVLHEEDDIDYPSNTNSRLAETLQAGDYTIEATTYYANKSGEFTLTISGLDSTQ